MTYAQVDKSRPKRPRKPPAAGEESVPLADPATPPPPVPSQTRVWPGEGGVTLNPVYSTVADSVGEGSPGLGGQLDSDTGSVGQPQADQASGDNTTDVDRELQQLVSGSGSGYADPDSCRAQAPSPDYDPVYVPTSDPEGMNKRVDNSGYVTSRQARMGSTDPDAYEEVRFSVDSPVTASPVPVPSPESPRAGSRSEGPPCPLIRPRNAPISFRPPPVPDMDTADPALDRDDTAEDRVLDQPPQHIYAAIDSEDGEEDGESGAGSREEPTHEAVHFPLLQTPAESERSRPGSQTRDSAVYETVDF